MLDLYISHAGITDGQEILDLGCGWGSVALYVAEKFPNSRVSFADREVASIFSFVPSFQKPNSSRTLTLEGLFELTRHPAGALNLATCVVFPELRRYKDTNRCCRPSRHLTQTAIVCWLKSPLFSLIKKLEGPGNPLFPLVRDWRCDLLSAVFKHSFGEEI